MKVVLELQDQPSNVRRITVRHDIVIGRGSDCNLRLSAPQVSRRHCFLRVGRDSVSVTDLDSSNGTYVDGARITAGKRYDIVDGAQLALGPIRFIIHMRSEAVAADSARSKMAAGIVNESRRDSIPYLQTANDGGTIAGGSGIANSDIPMDYHMEQGGDSAEPHEPTEDNLGHPFLATGLAGLISPAPDLMDSRLEIIDFGRRLSEESLSADRTGAVPQGDGFRNSQSDEDEEPQWESAIVDSSDSPEHRDVFSIADGSGVNSSCDREQTSDSAASMGAAAGDAWLSIDASEDTIFPQPFADAAVFGPTDVVADDFLDVEVIDEILEVADDVLEVDEESH